jgi:hypothetical protein
MLAAMARDPRPGAPPLLEGVAAVDYRGAQHVLGRTADSYAIWYAAGGAPLRTFPINDEGWAHAWRAYQELEAPVAHVPPSSWERGRPIPLRPMTAGRVIGGAFRMYRMYFFTLVAVVAPVMVVAEAIILGLALATSREISIDTPAGQIPSLETPTWVAFVAGLLRAAAVQFLTAAVVRTVVDGVQGRKASPAAAYRFAWPRIFAVGWVLILMIASALAPLIPGFLLLQLGTNFFFAPLAVLGVILLLAGAVGTTFIVVRLILGTVVVVVEDRRGGAAIRRSWNLVRGLGWRVLGVLVLTILIQIGVQLVIALPLAIPLVAGGFELTRESFALITAVNAIATIALTPVFGLVQILLYADARLRKEEPDPERLWHPVAASA